MENTTKLFLEVIRYGLQGEFVPRKVELNFREWSSLFQLAYIHKLYPMLADTMYLCPSFRSLGDKTVGKVQKAARSMVIGQALKTAEFLRLYRYLNSRSLNPIVMKGLICRNLYPQPEHRLSADEDLLIKPDQFTYYHNALMNYGMKLADPLQNIIEAAEVSYIYPGSDLYIELHKYPFSPHAGAYGDFNKVFNDVHERVKSDKIYGTYVYTLGTTDHLLYLIFHALKHFLYSGFGIRQVCDILLFSEYYKEQIDWKQVRMMLEEGSVFDFTRALYRIGDKYLLPENDMSNYLNGWKIEDADERDLLRDILNGGIYGVATKTRAHSAIMTLNAKTDKKTVTRGDIGGTGYLMLSIIRAVFLPVSDLKGRYPYLKKTPFLLPVAWIQRIAHFVKESFLNRKQGNTALESVSIGKERIELLREYGILDKKTMMENQDEGCRQ